jgi:uncharacterized lipoprotein YajG
VPKIRILLVLAGAVFIAGCETAPPIVETVIVEKPVPVPCKIPSITRPLFEVNRVSPADDMVTINRALRAELEQRRGYEIKLEAGVKACQ